MTTVIGLDFGTTNSAIAIAEPVVGSVFLTGGSSFVPYVRRFFAKTFGADKLRGGEELTTVAKVWLCGHSKTNSAEMQFVSNDKAFHPSNQPSHHKSISKYCSL